MKPVIIATIFSFLAACKSPLDNNNNETQSSENLDQAAISAGILSDPADIQLEGRFETRNDIGTDKFCAVKRDDLNFNIGILAVFGADSFCEGQGIAQLDGEDLIITLNKGVGNIEEICKFTASFDGLSIQLPGKIPRPCAKFCNNRASLSGTQFFQIENGNAIAKQSNGRNLNPLCKS